MYTLTPIEKYDDSTLYTFIIFYQEEVIFYSKYNSQDGMRRYNGFNYINCN